MSAPHSAWGVTVSVVVPCYNEAERLPSLLDGYRRLSTMVDEIIVVDDGSTDGTATLLHSLFGDMPTVRILSLDRNVGKGGAVAAGVATATGDSVVFMDADLATSLDDLPRLVDHLADNDVVIGSRAAPGHTVVGGRWYRGLMGRTFNRLVRRYTGLPFADTQCGFKAFRGSYAAMLFADLTLPRFSFDVEVLLRAHRLGLTMAEIPVHWTAVDGSHVRPVRDSLAMLRDVRAIERSGSLNAFVPAPQMA